MAGIRNFLLTFLIALIIFGVIAFFIVNMVLDSIGVGSLVGKDNGNVVVGGDEYTEDTGNQALEELDGKSFNMLLVGVDYVPEIFYGYYDPSSVEKLPSYDSSTEAGSLATDGEYRRISADTILLVSVSKERKEFAFTAISPGTLIERESGTVCLSDVYEQDGIEQFIEVVHSLVGLPIDRYAVVSINEFPNIVDMIDGVDFNVPVDMVYDDFKGNLHINIAKGNQHLNGEDALKVLRFNKYEDTSSSRLKTTIAFAKAVMSKMTAPKYITKAAALFKAASEMIVTDFTLTDLSSNLDLIFSYPNFDPVSIELPGTYTTIDGRLCFIPNETACYNILAPYRRINN